MYRTLFSLLANALIIFTVSNNATAETPIYYEVELALISYHDQQGFDSEDWPELLEKKPNYDEPNAPIMTEAFNHLPFTSLGQGFSRDIGRFNNAQGLNIIWNEKWKQSIPTKTSAQSETNLINIHIKAPLDTQTLSDRNTPLYEIEVSGNMYLYRSRYLHLVSDLEVQHWENLEGFQNSGSINDIQKIPVRASHVKHSRRMRSKELHYIDHPLLGVLIRITPVE